MKKQPNSSHCFVCGRENQYGLKLSFFTEDEGVVVSEITVPEQYQGFPGVVHGGIVASMLDEACGRAHMTEDPVRFMFTATLNLRYRKNTPTGKPLRLVGKVGKIKERTATSSAVLYDEQGQVLAEADALLVQIPRGPVAVAELEELGWKVDEE